MKKIRRILTAVALIMAIIGALSTATYAWFAMNTSVTATNMKVTAKTNGTFLQIKNEDGAANDAGTIANGKTSSAELYPAAVDDITSDSWIYAFSDEYDSYEADLNIGYMSVSSSKKDDYRLVNKFTIYSKDANNLPNNLCVKSFTVTGTSVFYDAIKIIVVAGDKVQELSANNTTSATANEVVNPVILTGEVSTTGIDVNVYIYIDGDSDVVTSENASVAANLTGLSVELLFGVDAPNN